MTMSCCVVFFAEFTFGPVEASFSNVEAQRVGSQLVDSSGNG